jgi:cysteinyl-tRNA synthetase
MAANRQLDRIKPSATSSVKVDLLKGKVYEALNDDLNSPVAIAVLFDWVRQINLLAEGKETISESDLHELKLFFRTVIFDILGLVDEHTSGSKHAELTAKLVEMLLNMRMEAKQRKDFAHPTGFAMNCNARGFEPRPVSNVRWEWCRVRLKYLFLKYKSNITCNGFKRE